MRELVGLREKFAVQIHDVIGMGHTPATRVLREAACRRLGQIGGVCSTLASLGLQAYPGIGWPGKTHIAESVAKAVPSLIVGIAGIDLQSLIGKVAKDAANSLLVVLSLDIAWRKVAPSSLLVITMAGTSLYWPRS